MASSDGAPLSVSETACVWTSACENRTATSSASATSREKNKRTRVEPQTGNDAKAAPKGAAQPQTSVITSSLGATGGWVARPPRTTGPSPHTPPEATRSVRLVNKRLQCPDPTRRFSVTCCCCCWWWAALRGGNPPGKPGGPAGAGRSCPGGARPTGGIIAGKPGLGARPKACGCPLGCRGNCQDAHNETAAHNSRGASASWRRYLFRRHVQHLGVEVLQVLEEGGRLLQAAATESAVSFTPSGSQMHAGRRGGGAGTAWAYKVCCDAASSFLDSSPTSGSSS